MKIWPVSALIQDVGEPDRFQVTDDDEYCHFYVVPKRMLIEVKRLVGDANALMANVSETFECGRCSNQGGGYIGNAESGYDWEDCECQGPPRVDNNQSSDITESD